MELLRASICQQQSTNNRSQLALLQTKLVRSYYAFKHCDDAVLTYGLPSLIFDGMKHDECIPVFNHITKVNNMLSII